MTRPFGGLNLLCVGDFYQLDPPEGGALSSIPTEFIRRARKYEPAPTISHSQALFWSGGDKGIQGITELHDVGRCKDEWLQEVQEELRHGRLSEDNWKFLHGERTSVPGSWTKGRAQCGVKACADLARGIAPSSTSAKASGAPPQKKARTNAGACLDITAYECPQCKEQR